MTTREPMLIGPFSRGINTYDDPTAIHDQEAAEALNFDPGLDGSLKSRPPFADTGSPLPVSGSETPRLLGYFYDSGGSAHLIASDGDSSTWSYINGVWNRITDTFAATDMCQYDGKAWLVSPVDEADPGGWWTPGGGFTADADMPEGTSITTYKSRLWIAEGPGSTNPTRIRYSKVLGQPDFWANSGFVDVGSGDGQYVIKIVTYFDSMLVFRTKSIWSFQYGVDPAQAIQSVTVPGIGLQSKFALVAYENYLYFMYDEKAYSFINNRAQQINLKVPFTSQNLGSTEVPYTVSLFNNRILYSFYDTVFVYSLRTNTWTTWKSDTWGPIGQLLMPFVDENTNTAFALPSGVSQPRAIEFTNKVWNPTFAEDLEYASVEDGNTMEHRTDISGSDHCVEWTQNNIGESYVMTANIPVTPGNPISAAARFRPSGAGSSSGKIGLVFIGPDGAAGHSNGTVVGSTLTGGSLPAPGQTWVRPVFEGEVVPVGAAFVRIRVIAGFSSGGGIKFAADDMIASETATVPDYFDGSTTDTSTHTYEWLDNANASESYKYLNGAIPLLRIEDRLTLDKEMMTCVLVTKNYNFSVPGSFKVLFYWGVDAIFKTNIQGQVVPGVYSQSTTWGQIRTAPKTWGDLLSGTWRHPFLADPSVVTDVETMSGPVRRFVKFLKKLRFRQIYFRVAFRIDGSSDTAPVQIFTLSTYMDEKQTVSKQVT